MSAHTLHSQGFSETITVLVGSEEDQCEFTVHKNLICAGSKFFNAACSKLWAEGKEKVVRLPNANAEAFQAYIVWIYAGKIAVNKSSSGREFRQTVELYLLGDVLDDLHLRNEAIRTLVEKSREWRFHPPPDLMNRIWNLTTPESQLRKMIVDKTIMRWDRAFTREVVDYPRELLQSLTMSLLDRVEIVPQAQFESGLEKYLESETSETPQEEV